MGKQKVFICPDCGIVIQFLQEVEIKPTDICPTCYFNWKKHGETTNIKTCILEEKVNNSRIILND